MEKKVTMNMKFEILCLNKRKPKKAELLRGFWAFDLQKGRF
uniref:Uncharacterized protein n=1 Tax=Meloidogyne enterolobii TaxID=390850 RepID=A0A6V7XIV8_MELEN|nr:unnamed protein product [Meloidogyne enterolobii]